MKLLIKLKISPVKGKQSIDELKKYNDIIREYQKIINLTIHQIDCLSVAQKIGLK